MAEKSGHNSRHIPGGRRKKAAGLFDMWREGRVFLCFHQEQRHGSKKLPVIVSHFSIVRFTAREIYHLLKQPHLSFVIFLCCRHSYRCTHCLRERKLVSFFHFCRFSSAFLESSSFLSVQYQSFPCHCIGSSVLFICPLSIPFPTFFSLLTNCTTYGMCVVSVLPHTVESVVGLCKSFLLAKLCLIHTYFFSIVSTTHILFPSPALSPALLSSITTTPSCYSGNNLV